MFFSFRLTAFLTGLVLLFSQCNKSVPVGKIDNGSIALTFDDHYIDNWFTYLPLLDSLGIKATFYISAYNSFNEGQKKKLATLAAHGHEVAYHTTNHANLIKAKAKSGLQYILEEEIKKDLAKMRNDGYNITSFAYPYGSHDKILDDILLCSFKSVRALSNRQDYNKSLVKESGEGKVLHGANIDMNSRLKEDGILDLIGKANTHHDCLVMVAHQIDNPNFNLQISRDRLRMIAAEAQKRSMDFITIRQIAY